MPDRRKEIANELDGLVKDGVFIWLAEQIRDPQSHNPNSRMPASGDKINEQDLRALATYLASLK